MGKGSWWAKGEDERDEGGRKERLTEHDGDLDEEVNQVEEVMFAGPYWGGCGDGRNEFGGVLWGRGVWHLQEGWCRRRME